MKKWSFEQRNTMLHTCVFVWQPCEHVQCLGDTSSWTPLCLLASPQWTDMLEARYCTNQHSTSHVTSSHHSPPVQPQPPPAAAITTSQTTSTTIATTSRSNQHLLVHNSTNTCTLREFSGDYKNCDCLWTVDECSVIAIIFEQCTSHNKQSKQPEIRSCWFQWYLLLHAEWYWLPVMEDAGMLHAKELIQLPLKN